MIYKLWPTCNWSVWSWRSQTQNWTFPLWFRPRKTNCWFLLADFCWLLEFSAQTQDWGEKEPLGGSEVTDLPPNMKPTLPNTQPIIRVNLASPASSVCYRNDKRVYIQLHVDKPSSRCLIIRIWLKLKPRHGRVNERHKPLLHIIIIIVIAPCVSADNMWTSVISVFLNSLKVQVHFGKLSAFLSPPFSGKYFTFYSTTVVLSVGTYMFEWEAGLRHTSLIKHTVDWTQVCVCVSTCTHWGGNTLSSVVSLGLCNRFLSFDLILSGGPVMTLCLLNVAPLNPHSNWKVGWKNDYQSKIITF